MTGPLVTSRKSDNGFIIGDSKTREYTFSPILWRFFISVAILNPPFWIVKVWKRIRNQRPQKPVYTKFHKNPIIRKVYAWKGSKKYKYWMECHRKIKKIKTIFLLCCSLFFHSPFLPFHILTFAISTKYI